MKKKLIRVLNQILGLFPSRLPTGVAEFQAWAQSIADTYTLPTQDQDSIQFTLATIIQHSAKDQAFASKYRFANLLRAGATKQIAGHIFTVIRTKKLDEIAKLEAETKKAAVLT